MAYTDYTKDREHKVGEQIAVAGGLVEIVAIRVPEMGERYLYKGRVTTGGGSTTRQFPIVRPASSSSSFNNQIQNTTKTQGNTMNIINSLATQTLINDREVSTYSKKDMTNLIIATEKEIDELRSIKKTSSYIKARIAELEDNIAKVIFILDDEAEAKE